MRPLPAKATSQTHDFLPATPSPAVTRVFLLYLRRLVRKSFHAVRIATGTREHLEALATSAAPGIAVMNHCSWWDPLTGLWLNDRFGGSRTLLAPMEAAQLRRFSFFRKLGVFGINPDSPEAFEFMQTYLAEQLGSNPRSTLWITPQGQFTDVREPIRIRPGVAAIAAKLPHPAPAISVAIEYAFWADQRPELLLRVAPIDPPAEPSTTGWTRAIRDAMQSNAGALAQLSIKRDPQLFETLDGGDTAKVHPLYDLYLKVTGRAGAINPVARTPARRPGPKGPPTEQRA